MLATVSATLVGVEGRPVEVEVPVSPPDPSPPVARRVHAARGIAPRRGVPCNSAIPAPDLDELAPIASAALKLAETRLRQRGVSARGAHRIRRDATTLADLAGHVGAIGEDHVLSAPALRGTVFERERMTV